MTSWAGPEGEIYVKKVAVQELWLEEGAKPSRIFKILAIFSTLTYLEPQKTTSGPVFVHASLPRLGQKLTQKIEKLRDVLFGCCRLRTLYLSFVLKQVQKNSHWRLY